MKRLTSASGTTTANGEDIMSVLRAATTLPQGVDDRGVSQDTYYPFRPVLSYFESDVNTTISLNGEGATFLKLDVDINKYIIGLEEEQVLVKTFTVADSGTVWRATFLY